MKNFTCGETYVGNASGRSVLCVGSTISMVGASLVEGQSAMWFGVLDYSHPEVTNLLDFVSSEEDMLATYGNDTFSFIIPVTMQLTEPLEDDMDDKDGIDLVLFRDYRGAIFCARESEALLAYSRLGAPAKDAA